MSKSLQEFLFKNFNFSKKPIYTAHAVDPEMPRVFIDYIGKFSVVESHYCRAHSQRLYLESTSTVPKM